MALLGAMAAAPAEEDGLDDDADLGYDDDADMDMPPKRLKDGEDTADRWVDGLLKYRHRSRLWLFSDPRGVLVRGTGTSMWSAGEVLVDYMADNPELYRDGACLDLGAGLGAVGLTMAARGARRVLLTDVERQVPLLVRNAEENFPANKDVQVRALDWRIPEQRADRGPWHCPWSVVVGSDIGYDPELFEPLLETLVSQCSAETSVYFALADREEDDEPDVKDFVEAASSRFDCVEVHARQLEPGQSVTKVIRLRLKPSVLAPN